MGCKVVAEEDDDSFVAQAARMDLKDHSEKCFEMMHHNDYQNQSSFGSQYSDQNC